MNMKIGIYGGTFSPVHNGHVAIAKAFVSQTGIDRLYIIPNFSPPHKSDVAGADTGDRVYMLREAMKDIPKAEISDMEIKRGGKSYTVDTLRELSKEGELFLLCGSDMFLSIETWREPSEIFRLAHIVVGRRENDFETGEQIRRYKADLETRCNASVIEIFFPPVVVSSEEIREKIKKGLPIDGLLPEGVAEYIKKKHLYV